MNQIILLRLFVVFQTLKILFLPPIINSSLFLNLGGIGPYAEHTPGYFALMDLSTYEKIVPNIIFGENLWGDASCARSELDIFNPHGIDLVKNNEGSYQLVAVINHSPFESIEMFEMIKTESSWDMLWRGCIRVPDQYYFNDIALKKDGSFYASHMYKRDISMEEWLMNSLFKSISGHIVLWWVAIILIKLMERMGVALMEFCWMRAQDSFMLITIKGINYLFTILIKILK